MKRLIGLTVVMLIVLSVGIGHAQDEQIQTVTVQARYYYALDQHQDYLEFEFQINKGESWQGLAYQLPPLSSDLDMDSNDQLMCIWIDGELLDCGYQILVPASNSQRWMEIRIYNHSEPVSHITGSFNNMVGHLYLISHNYLYDDLTVIIGGYNGQWHYRYQGDAIVRVSVVNLVVGEKAEFQYWKTVTNDWPDLYIGKYSWPINQSLIHQNEWLEGGYMAFQVIFPE